MREKTNYREQLEVLTKLYPGKVTLSVSETSRALGIDRKTVTALIEKNVLPATNVGLGKQNKFYIIPITAIAKFSVG